MTPEEATKSIGLRFTLRGNNCELTIHDTEILIIVRQVRSQALEEAAKVAEAYKGLGGTRAIAAAIRALRHE